MADSPDLASVLAQVVQLNDELRLARASLQGSIATPARAARIEAARAQLRSLIDVMLDHYRVANDEQRRLCRSTVAANSGIALEVEQLVAADWAAVCDTGSEEALDRFLAALTLCNGYPDYRDVLLALCAAYLAAVWHGIDPDERFRAAANLTGDDAGLLGFDMGHVLRDFESFAVCAEQVAPKLRDVRRWSRG